MRYLPILLLILLGVPGSTLWAEETWRVMTGDFRVRMMELSRIDAQSVVGKVGNKVETVDLKNFVMASRNARVEFLEGLVLCLAGGDRLVGQPVELNNTHLIWFVSGIGRVRVPVEQILGILRNSSDDPRLLEDRNEDVMFLSNGDVVRGIVTAVTERTITITPTGADPIEMAVATIRDLLFATPPQGRAAHSATGYIVRLTNGVVISCRKVELKDNKAFITVNDGSTSSVPIYLVVSIEYMSGPVEWLSMRQPAEITYFPYFDGNFPPRMDKTIAGEPIRVNGQPIQRGISMHSHTRMSFPIRAGDQKFRSRYWIDPSLGLADVDVRVYVDDKVVHENKGFKAGDLSPVIEIDVAGAQRLTLEVDFGQGYDIQDRVVWVEPAFIRE